MNPPEVEIYKPERYLKEDELPGVSICIPCYKRHKFLPLILCNIREMIYPKDKIEVNILQDGPEDLFESPEEIDIFRKMIHPAQLKYKYEKNVRRSIGEKRNLLVKSSKYKWLAMMDSDDIYFPTYLIHSISALKLEKKGISTSVSMMFVYPDDNYKLTAIQCPAKLQGHEACCVFTIKHFRAMGGFVSKGEQSSRGEGIKMISYGENRMINLDITHLMCCVAHGGEEGNTINKDIFKDKDCGSNLQNLIHVDILKKIFD
jgi:hypothetical protein